VLYGLFQDLVETGGGRGFEHQPGVGQDIEDGAERRIMIRKAVFQPGRRPGWLGVLGERHDGRHGIDGQFAHRARRPLARGIERVDGGDPAAIERQAIGRRAGRKQVHHFAADRKLAVVVDAMVRPVAESRETGLEGIGPDLVADRDLEHLGRGLGGRLALDQGLESGDQHGARARSAGRVSIEPPQRRHLLAQDVGRRGGHDHRAGSPRPAGTPPWRRAPVRPEDEPDFRPDGRRRRRRSGLHPRP